MHTVHIPQMICTHQFSWSSAFTEDLPCQRMGSSPSTHCRRVTTSDLQYFQPELNRSSSLQSRTWNHPQGDERSILLYFFYILLHRSLQNSKQNTCGDQTPLERLRIEGHEDFTFQEASCTESWQCKDSRGCSFSIRLI